MTRPKRNDAVINVTKQDLMEMLTEDNAIKVLLQKLLQEVLETEMEEALQAGTWRLILHRVSQSSTLFPLVLLALYPDRFLQRMAVQD